MSTLTEIPEEQKEVTRQKVLKGASFLDERYPDWFKKIDLSRLEMNQCLDCILGQLYGLYETGKEVLNLGSFNARNYGFNLFEEVEGWRSDHWHFLNECWKAETQKRLEHSSVV